MQEVQHREGIGKEENTQTGKGRREKLDTTVGAKLQAFLRENQEVHDMSTLAISYSLRNIPIYAKIHSLYTYILPLYIKRKQRPTST
jgi:dynactin complex subunit